MITDYERSLRSKDVQESVNESGDDNESSSDEDELRQSLADELCSKADELYQNRCVIFCFTMPFLVCLMLAATPPGHEY